MKNFLFLISFLLLCISCSDEEPVPFETFTGMYELVSFQNSGCSLGVENLDLNFKDDEDDNCDSAILIKYCAEGMLSFSEDGTVESDVRVSASVIGEIYGLSGKGSYEVKDSFLTVCLGTCTDFRIEGNKLFGNKTDGRCEQDVEYVRL